MRPGAPSDTTGQRAAQAAGDEAAPELRPVLDPLALAEADVEQHPVAVGREAPGDEDALLGPVGPDRQVDGVEHQAEQADLAQAARPERPVPIPELAADRADRGPADVTQTGLAGETLDVAIGQAPDVGTNDQRLERSGPDDRPGVGDRRADEPGETVADLGHGDRQLALGGLDPAGPVTVPGTAGRLRPLVASPAEERLEFVLDGPLEDEPGAQAAELGEPVGLLEPGEQGRLDRGLDLDAGGYSSIHGVVS